MMIKLSTKIAMVLTSFMVGIAAISYVDSLLARFILGFMMLMLFSASVEYFEAKFRELYGVKEWEVKLDDGMVPPNHMNCRHSLIPVEDDHAFNHVILDEWKSQGPIQGDVEPMDNLPASLCKLFLNNEDVWRN